MVAIFVALMFIGFILIDLSVQRLEARRAAAAMNQAAVRNVLSPRAASSASLDDWTWIPDGFFLANGHTWLLPQEQGFFRIGADVLVSRALGAVSRVIPPKVGQEVWAGRPLFHLEHNGRALTVASPVSGKVLSVNDQIQDRPDLIVKGAYSAGWVCVILPTRLVQEKTALRVGDRARAWLRQEVDRFSQFLWARVPSDAVLGATIPDGGIPAPGSLLGFDAADWNAFEHDFLCAK